MGILTHADHLRDNWKGIEVVGGFRPGILNGQQDTDMAYYLRQYLTQIKKS